MRKHAGFSLLEVVAAAALIGVIMTFMAPSIKGAFDKVADNKLRNDLVAVGQAMQIYKAEKGSYPAKLEDLTTEKYINTKEFKDAVGNDIKFTVSGNDCTVSGEKTDGKTLTYDGYELKESTTGGNPS